MANEYLTEPTLYTKNFKNVNRVLEWLYNGAPHTTFSIEVGSAGVDEYIEIYQDDVEDSPEVPEGCGSVCCIAGAAFQMDLGIFGDIEPDADYPWTHVQHGAERFFGIDTDNLGPQIMGEYANDFWMLDVFSPHLSREALGGQPTPAQAAQALLNFAKDGDPAWGTV